MAEQQSSGTHARIKDRVNRARRLVEEGRVGRQRGLHVVNGNGGNYKVSLEDQTCSCRAGREGMACYHVQAVEQFEAADRCRRQKTAKPKTDRRHKADDYSLAGITADMDALDRVAARLGV